uniref:Uncharacterized protein n=2 Tax=Lotharella globosa TaxID=91324 RepID=A0A6V3JY21_9EUKA|mmetsp:Transcript_37920/g.72923  ORF Transcript_37920/g.72923 Transcript_37920/m.72923 type:complete len:149 (-) Transcript_37920:322-768(-)
MEVKAQQEDDLQRKLANGRITKTAACIVTKSNLLCAPSQPTSPARSNLERTEALTTRDLLLIIKIQRRWRRALIRARERIKEKIEEARKKCETDLLNKLKAYNATRMQEKIVRIRAFQSSVESQQAGSTRICSQHPPNLIVPFARGNA